MPEFQASHFFILKILQCRIFTAVLIGIANLFRNYLKGAVIKSAIVETPPPEAFASGNITILRTNREKYDPYVLFEYLNSSQGMLELEKIQSGTTIRILNNTNLKTFQIPVYDKSLMEKIGSRLKRNRKIYFQKLKNLEEDYNKERNILNGLLKEEGEHETKEQ